MDSENPSNHGIEQSLAAYFSADGQLASSPNRSFSDADINAISTLLYHVAKSWSKIPRTYIVLRTIGHLDRMDEFVEAGFTDHWFPVTTQYLPAKLDPTIKNAFEKAQVTVLTKSIDLEKGRNGKHQHFARGESIPFEPKAILGATRYTQVDKVISTISGRAYARKRIQRGAYFDANKSKERMKEFISEVKILKQIKHQHIVEFVGSYTDAAYLGFIMSPVADMDLAHYLKQSPARKPTIRSFFGCLATALQFLHDNNIRHKDVKPKNVLVHGSNILFTDFGLSRDADGMGSTTSGPTAKTVRYCAPEVFADGKRNSSSDLWSLGCIFLELVAVLKEWKMEDFHAYFEENGTQNPYFHNNLPAVAELNAKLRASGLKSDNDPVDWAEMMLKEDRRARPTAAELTVKIIEGKSKYGAESPFCGLCCGGVDGFDDMDYLDDGFDNLTEATKDALQIKDNTLSENGPQILGENGNSTTAISWLTERGWTLGPRGTSETRMQLCLKQHWLDIWRPYNIALMMVQISTNHTHG
jgi:serine/threonine protein kinase